MSICVAAKCLLIVNRGYRHCLSAEVGTLCSLIKKKDRFTSKMFLRGDSVIIAEKPRVSSQQVTFQLFQVWPSGDTYHVSLED
jgi:hypothetical protein